MKTCSRCGQQKAAEPVLSAGGDAQGRRGACKECFKAAERAAYARDPEVQAARMRRVERWRSEGLKF